MAEFGGNKPNDIEQRNTLFDRIGPFSLKHLAEKQQIEIGLKGEEVAGIKIGEDQEIKGAMIDNGEMLMRVEEAQKQLQLVGREIVLSAVAPIMTPPGIVITRTLRHCMAKGRMMAYYYPEDVPADSEYGVPKEYHYIAATYESVKVGGKILFKPLGQNDGK